MVKSIVGFDWDAGNWPKCAKHGVTRGEIEEVFQGDLAVMPDPCPGEQRLRAIGTSREGRYLFIVFMFRVFDGERWIRPISARYMHQREIDRYERS